MTRKRRPRSNKIYTKITKDMSRKKNKESNAWVRATFLKRDSNVGLFKIDDDIKIRLHQDNIQTRLSLIDKGTVFTIPPSLIDNSSIVSNQRCRVTNPKKKSPIVPFDGAANEEKNHKMSEHTMASQVFETKSYDKGTYYLPVGTKYYWMGIDDAPTKDSCALFSDWDKDEHKVVFIKKVSSIKEGAVFGIVLSINGKVCDSSSGEGLMELKDRWHSDCQELKMDKCMFTLLDDRGKQMGYAKTLRMLKAKHEQV